MVNRTRMLALGGSCLLSACATIISGPRQSVKIDSVPQGAKVFTAVLASSRQGTLRKRVEVGVTPMTVSITRKDGVVELEKDGFLPSRVPMKRGLNPWFLGNILMTSMVSSSVDSSTGAISEYDPDQYLVEMQKDASFVAPPAAPNSPSPSNPPAAAPAEESQGEEPLVPDVRPLSPSPAPAPPKQN